MTAPPDLSTDTRRRRRRVTILIVFLSLILLLLFAFRAVLTPFLVALFVAYLLDPVIERMAPLRLFGKVRLGRGFSIIIIYLVFLLAVYLGGSFAGPAFTRQLKQARDDLPAVQATFEEKLQQAIDALQNWWGDEPKKAGNGAENGNQGEDGEGKDKEKPANPPRPERSRFHLKGGGVIEGLIIDRGQAQVVLKLGNGYQLLDLDRVEREEVLDAGQVPIDPKQYSRKLVNELIRNLDDILVLTVNFAVKIVRTFVLIVLIMMVTAFLLIDRKHIIRFIQSLPPQRYQATWKHLLVYVDRGLAGVIRGQLTICAVNGILTWIGLAVLGVRYSGLLGFIAGVFSLIPVFGTVLSTVPIVLIAWGAGSFYQGMLALGWILLIHFIEANFLNPKIMGTAAKIHPVVIIFALIAGEHAYGIVGALLAVPTASIVQSFFKFYVIDRQHEVSYPEDEEEEPEAVMVP